MPCHDQHLGQHVGQLGPELPIQFARRQALIPALTRAHEKRLGQLTDFLMQFQNELVVVTVDTELFGVQARNGLQVVRQQSQVHQVTISPVTRDGRQNR